MCVRVYSRGCRWKDGSIRHYCGALRRECGGGEWRLHLRTVQKSPAVRKRREGNRMGQTEIRWEWDGGGGGGALVSVFEAL